MLRRLLLHLRLLRDYRYAVVDDEGYEHDRYMHAHDAHVHAHGRPELHVEVDGPVMRYLTPNLRLATGRVR